MWAAGLLQVRGAMLPNGWSNSGGAGAAKVLRRPLFRQCPGLLQNRLNTHTQTASQTLIPMRLENIGAERVKRSKNDVFMGTGSVRHSLENRAFATVLAMVNAD